MARAKVRIAARPSDPRKVNPPPAPVPMIQVTAQTQVRIQTIPVIQARIVPRIQKVPVIPPIQTLRKMNHQRKKAKNPKMILRPAPLRIQMRHEVFKSSFNSLSFSPYKKPRFNKESVFLICQ